MAEARSIAPAQQDHALLRLAMAWSLGIGVVLLFTKAAAYYLTGSTAILADAAESVVHVVAVVFAFYSLRLSQKPADPDHPYGHAKISFFSAGFEGAMIMLAAIYIIAMAIYKWWQGLELENLGWGVLLTGLAALINLFLGLYLHRLGRRKGSLILQADGKHVLTDVVTSAGVLLGLALTHLTGWMPWDPLAAIGVACVILYTGFGLVRNSFGGLMDRSDPEIQKRLEIILPPLMKAKGISYHLLRHRNLGDGHWVDLHLVFDDNTPVWEAHAIATEVEKNIRASMPTQTIVTTHLEPERDHDRIHPRSKV